jgi:hypothetical protein
LQKTGKQGASPFGGGFGASPKASSGTQKQGASPFGGGLGTSPKKAATQNPSKPNNKSSFSFGGGNSSNSGFRGSMKNPFSAGNQSVNTNKSSSTTTSSYKPSSAGGFGIEDLKKRVEQQKPSRGIGQNINASINDERINGYKEDGRSRRNSRQTQSQGGSFSFGSNKNSATSSAWSQTQGEIRLDTNAETERLRADERARRLEQVRMEGIEEARREEQRRRQIEETQTEQRRLQLESRARMEAERSMSEAKKYEAVNGAIAASDDNYVPPKTVLDSKSVIPLLEQIDGPLMYEYKGKEATYTGRSTKIYGGSALDIPIRVSAPGSIVEYTIEKRSYDFGLGITAKLDQGGATVVKPMIPFDGKDVVADRPRQKTQSDQVLVGAGSVPCTLNFKFENKFSWITEVSYKIRVIPPSTQMLLTGRRRRATAGIRALDNDIGQTNMRLNDANSRRSMLQNEAESLAQQVQMSEINLQQTRDEEWNIRMMEGGTKNSRTASTNRFEF